MIRFLIRILISIARHFKYTCISKIASFLSYTIWFKILTMFIWNFIVILICLILVSFWLEFTWITRGTVVIISFSTISANKCKYFYTNIICKKKAILCKYLGNGITQCNLVIVFIMSSQVISVNPYKISLQTTFITYLYKEHIRKTQECNIFLRLHYSLVFDLSLKVGSAGSWRLRLRNWIGMKYNKSSGIRIWRRPQILRKVFSGDFASAEKLIGIKLV